MNVRCLLVGLAVYGTMVTGMKAVAQQRTLTLEEVYELAEQNSRSIQAHRAELRAQQEGVRNARSERLPDIQASAGVSYLGNSYLMSRHFSDGQSIHMPHMGNNFALQVSQAVFTGGAISSGIRMAELSEQLARLDMQQDIQQVRYLLTGYYLDLCKLQNQEQVLKEDLDLTDRLIQNISERHAQGTALRNDITRYELRKQSLLLQLEEVRNTRSIVNHQMANVLGIDTETEIRPDTAFLSRPPQTGTRQEWELLAIENSPQLHMASTSVELARQQLRQSQSELLPKISLQARENLDGPITIEVPTINKNINYWSVGVGVSYNLSSLYKGNHRVKQSRQGVSRRESERELALQQVSDAVQAAYVRLNEADTNLQTHQKAMQLATENYAVVENRYQNELALLTDMLDASTQRLQAELDLLNARIDLVYRHYTLRYVCGDL